jgi:excisionase family DNA binding protein
MSALLHPTSELVGDRPEITLTVPMAPDFFRALAESVAQLLADQQSQLPEYFTTGEVADYLGYPPKRIDNLCAMNRIPFRKDGGRRIFVRQEIDAWVHALQGPTVQDALAVAV